MVIAGGLYFITSHALVLDLQQSTPLTRTAVSAWCLSGSGRCCSPDGTFKRQHAAFIFNLITDTSLLTRNELHEYEVVRRSRVNCRFFFLLFNDVATFPPLSCLWSGLNHQCWIYIALYVSSKCFLTSKFLWSCNINMEGDIPVILEQFMSSSLVTWVSCSFFLFVTCKT